MSYLAIFRIFYEKLKTILGFWKNKLIPEVDRSLRMFPIVILSTRVELNKIELGGATFILFHLCCLDNAQPSHIFLYS